MFIRRASMMLALAAMLSLVSPAAWAQVNNNNNTNNNTNNNGNILGAAGVQIDANGVLSMKIARDPNGQLTRQRIAQAKGQLAADIAKASKLRKVSLTRLEAAVAERIAAGQAPTQDMAHLAGLTAVQYVFFYPETKDIVIAGPAEGYMVDATGRSVGIETGAAIVLLEDMVTAMRAYPPTGKQVHQIRCSIDPTKEGLENMQKFLVALAKRGVAPSDAQFIAAGLKENLGLQVVSIDGISPQTHFAQVLVEADYRMKLIGIGLETPPVKIPSFVSKANPATISQNALQRWYFTPNYECVKVSDDELAMELVGQGVKLIGEDELVNGDGSRVVAGAHSNAASKAFTEAFTAKYAELAKKSPVYAQLKNVVDLAVAAAFMQEKDYYGRAGWDMKVFGDEGSYKTQTCETPKAVESTVNVIWKGNRLMTPIGGGVDIQARRALDSQNLLKDDKGEVKEARAKLDLTKLQKSQWWWD